MSPKAFNEWRIVPRILMLAYYAFFAMTFWEISSWVMAYDFNSLTSETIALAVVGFPTAILGVLSAVLSSLTNNYFRTGGTVDQGDDG